MHTMVGLDFGVVMRSSGLTSGTSIVATIPVGGRLSSSAGAAMVGLSFGAVAMAIGIAVVLSQI